MRRVFLTVLVSLALVGSAAGEVYKWVDKDGKVHYSDSPPKDAKPADLKPLTTLESTPLPRSADSDPAEPASATGGGYTLKILSPASGETVTNIGTLLVVNLDVQPALQPNHQIFVTYDGERYQAAGTTVTLSNVFRGQHSLSAEIQDEGGRALASAGPVTFNVQQNSVLQKLPGVKPPPTKK